MPASQDPESKDPDSEDPNPKDSVRRDALSMRRALHGSQGDLASTIRKQFLSKFGVGPTTAPKCVAGYWPTGSEISDLDLLSALAGFGWSVLLPKVLAPDQPLAFVPWQPGDDLVEGAHGIMVPDSKGQEIITSQVPDIALVPLLAYDHAGYRLGQGGGYYDRTLNAWRKRWDVLAVGLAYDGQEIDVLPRHDHDEPLDMVITDLRVTEFAKA